MKRCTCFQPGGKCVHLFLQTGAQGAWRCASYHSQRHRSILGHSIAGQEHLKSGRKPRARGISTHAALAARRNRALLAAAAPMIPGFHTVIFPGSPRVCALSIHTSATAARHERGGGWAGAPRAGVHQQTRSAGCGAPCSACRRCRSNSWEAASLLLQITPQQTRSAAFMRPMSSAASAASSVARCDGSAPIALPRSPSRSTRSQVLLVMW